MPTMPRIVLLITNSFVSNIRLLYLHEFADYRCGSLFYAYNSQQGNIRHRTQPWVGVALW